MALQPDAYPYRRARCHRYGMPLGKTSAVPWFSSMITRILLTPPTATGACVAGDDAAGAVGTGAGLDAVGPGGPALQPAARQPASTPPVSRASRRRGIRLAGTVQASLTAETTSSRSGRTRASSVTHRYRMTPDWSMTKIERFASPACPFQAEYRTP